jgi:hypothetical protein
MSSSRRYVTNEQGERISVLLDLEGYQQMTRQLLRPDASDPEILIGLSEAGLQALAHSILAPAAQSRLDDLLTRNTEAQLSETEQMELDRLLNDIDQLTILKTRARYTLAHQTGTLQTSCAHVPAALRRQIRAPIAQRCASCQTAESLTVASFEIEQIM